MDVNEYKLHMQNHVNRDKIGSIELHILTLDKPNIKSVLKNILKKFKENKVGI